MASPGIGVGIENGIGMSESPAGGTSNVGRVRQPRPNTSHESCAICAEVYTADKPPHSLPCNHAFHASCLVTAFQAADRSLCPMCRQQDPEQALELFRQIQRNAIATIVEPPEAQQLCKQYARATREFNSAAAAHKKELTRVKRAMETKLRAYRTQLVEEAGRQMEAYRAAESGPWTRMHTARKKASLIRTKITRLNLRTITFHPKKKKHRWMKRFPSDEVTRSCVRIRIRGANVRLKASGGKGCIDPPEIRRL